MEFVLKIGISERAKSGPGGRGLSTVSSSFSPHFFFQIPSPAPTITLRHKMAQEREEKKRKEKEREGKNRNKEYDRESQKICIFQPLSGNGNVVMNESVQNNELVISSTINPFPPLAWRRRRPEGLEGEGYYLGITYFPSQPTFFLVLILFLFYFFLSFPFLLFTGRRSGHGMLGTRMGNGNSKGKGKRNGYGYVNAGDRRDYDSHFHAVFPVSYQYCS